MPLRVLENDMTKKYLQMEREGRDRSELEKYSEKAWKAAVELGDIKEGSFIAGLTVSQIKEIKPVKEILEELMKEYQREMEKIYNEFKQ